MAQAISNSYQNRVSTMNCHHPVFNTVFLLPIIPITEMLEA
jgi:hypothetical protein